METYPEEYTPGIPAKSLYRKFGFVERMREELQNSYLPNPGGMIL